MADRRFSPSPPSAAPVTIASFPFDPIRLACGKCGRAGQYRRATLLARFGPAASMPDVLVALANCPRHADASDPCGVVYRDLASR
jgi:hypothetical protein